MAFTKFHSGRHGAASIIDSGDMSSNITSDEFDLRDSPYGSIQVHSESGTRAGTLTIEVSNDPAGSLWDTWEDSGGTSSWSVVASTEFHESFNLWPAVFDFYRVVYASTSGAGTLNAYASSIGV